MNRLAHILIGFSIGLYLGSGITSLLYALCSALGAYTPDIRHPPMRRGKLSHSLVTPILLFLLTYSVSEPLSHETSYAWLVKLISTSFYAFLLGWVSHILADSLSAGGVFILWPLSNKCVKLTSLRSDSLILNLLGVLIAFTLLYIWLVVSGASTYIEELVEWFLKPSHLFLPTPLVPI